MKVGVVLLEGSAGLRVDRRVRARSGRSSRCSSPGCRRCCRPASVARTSKVWLPAPSAGEIVSGLVQAVQLPPSTRHSNVELPSLELNENAGVVSLEGSPGCELMVVLGAVRSTVQV